MKDENACKAACLREYNSLHRIGFFQPSEISKTRSDLKIIEKDLTPRK